MEKSNYQADFEMGLSTLEDIQLLSEFSLSPLVGRAYFHLTELKRKADFISSGKVASYESVTKVLEEKFESIFTDFLSDKSKFKDFSYKNITSKLDLKKWNLIFEIIPEVLSVVSLFNYEGTVETKLDEEQIIISGVINQDSINHLNRKFIYIATRKLLRQKVLLTFNLKQLENSGLFKLELRADISQDDSLAYKVNFKTGNKENYLVSFSNVFANYQVNLESLKDLGEHNIVEVTSNLEVKHSFSVLDSSRLESASKEILHFPFLFRPVSIILPMKGNLSLDGLSDSQNDEHKREQDVSTYYRTIDFFSLFDI